MKACNVHLLPDEADIVTPVRPIILLLEMPNFPLLDNRKNTTSHAATENDEPFEPTVGICRMEEVQLAPFQRCPGLHCGTLGFGLHTSNVPDV